MSFYMFYRIVRSDDCGKHNTSETNFHRENDGDRRRDGVRMAGAQPGGPHPIPEFRDADQYWGSNNDPGHEIIRPKPRRPGDGHRVSGGESSGVMLRTQQQQQQQQQQSPQTSTTTGSRDLAPYTQQQQQQQQLSKTPVRDVGGGSTPALKSQPTRDQPQGRGREGRAGSRERLVVAPLSLAQRDYPRHDYYQHKPQDYPSKPQDYPSKLQDYSSKNQDYPTKPQDYPCKNGASTPVYKAQSREVVPAQRQQSPGVALGMMSSPGGGGGGGGLRERVASPHRVTSPPVKLQEPQRMASPPVKMSDPRSQHDFGKPDIVKLEGSPAGGVGVPRLSPAGVGSHFVQQYPERDTPAASQGNGSNNSSNSNAVWEGGYPLTPEKYPVNGPPTSTYSPLSLTALHLQSSPSHGHRVSHDPPEKVIDALEQKKDISYTSGSNNNGSPGLDDAMDDKYREYPAEKDEGDPEVLVDGCDLKKLAEVTSKMALTVLPDDVDTYNELNKHHLNGHLSAHLEHLGRPAGQLTPESTDCGSLSKSSSDGDNMMNRKRPPTKLKSKRRNILSFPHHLSVDELRVIQRRQDSYGGGSSSDENRSSGHASMSDGHTSSSPPIDTLPRHEHLRSNLKVVPEDERLSAAVTSAGAGYKGAGSGRRGQPRPRHRATPSKDDLCLTLESASGLEDIKQAIEQLTMRSQGSRTSYSTSTYSSMSGSEGEPVRRLMRHSSLETINTNVTSADEFVWVDNHNRLVELQQLPWSNHDVLRVVQQGRVREQLDRVSMEAVPRLSYLLQRALVRVAREAQRLTRPLAMCSKQEVSSALKIVLSPALADSCIKACLRAAAMYTVCGDQLRQSKSARAGLNLSVGRFMRWMCDVRIGKFIHEYAAVYLTAGMENLLEEMVLQCLPAEEDHMLTASVLEHAIANNGDLWGLLQPYAHLNAGRTATGALCLPRWASTNSIEASSGSGGSSTGANRGSGGSAGSGSGAGAGATSSTPVAQGGNDGVGNCNSSSGPQPSRCSSSVTLTPEEHTRSSKTLEQSLLTTCVGSLAELSELLSVVALHHHRATSTASPSRAQVTWGPSALHALFYFMRCSQLEHAEHASRAPIQELVYERPYIVLPPILEWVRVATAHTEHRHSTVVDKDDVMQAARLLLPGVDCPVRMIGYEELMCPRRQLDELECAKKFKVDLAFKMLSCGRTDLVPHALQLLPATKVNTVNEYGLTPLMLACIRGDEPMVNMLLDAGADVDAETPPTGPAYLMANPETQHWTALTYAAIHGHLNIAKTLLEKNGNVEGGARLAEEKCTETPLQVAAAAGHTDMIALLLTYVANPYLSTLMKDSLCYSGAAQRGCYAAIAVAAAHGQRPILHKLLSQPQHASAREVLSLEEILAEGANGNTSDRDRRPGRQMCVVDDPLGRGSLASSTSESSQVVKLTKQQIKTLQEAMYHSAESGHLEMTLDLRNMGVPWTLHCWMHTLATAHEHRLESIIDQLLQDFLQVWPDDYSAQFVDECLPLLFNIFRYSKNEGTSLLLADIFSSCYGKEPIKEIRDTTISGGARIDPKFVNNPELSDVQFRVEGRVFYAHKIILVNASSRFKQMLSSKFCEGNPPIVQIHDIRYDIFELVMQSLYKGGCENLEVEAGDVLELMAAANFFQLDSLLRYCESRCSKLVLLDNVVSMYIHAKVYNAVQLLEYCQGFLLQNMVALLTYDDSVRRLIFGKKLHNHDVLAGLLLTLQARIKARSSPRAGKK
ncbi:ankyrin repeat and BTB/POZ domain-containing protein 3-A-like isoform X2 [Macrobrachium nipponense]|uniref:ankyrin repeat and BTB/POZ domain-containing protein 3-A-like isoform X2 n=2 Tax=Macrobrachium nipponense TaxID=159736 RepID=UPI0030C8891E